MEKKNEFRFGVLYSKTARALFTDRFPSKILITPKYLERTSERLLTFWLYTVASNKRNSRIFARNVRELPKRPRVGVAVETATPAVTFFR